MVSFVSPRVSRTLLHLALLPAATSLLASPRAATMRAAQQNQQAVSQPTMVMAVSPLALRGGAAAAAAALPSINTLAAASVLPTLLGLWRTGYAVSYAYGGAVAACAALTLPALSGIARWHALALIFYGVRLNAHLFYRECALPREISGMKAKDATLAERLKRAPVILGCSLLYFLLAAPLRVTATAAASSSKPLQAAVACAFLGFAVAALGDLQKLVTKTIKGKDHLVTGGLYKWLRHPNYTGEVFGWSASFAAALIAGAAAAGGGVLASARTLLTNPWIGASALGWLGIMFVLAGEASVGLEKKQKAKYGGQPEYEAWLKGSWAGPVFDPKKSA